MPWILERVCDESIRSCIVEKERVSRGSCEKLRSADRVASYHLRRRDGVLGCDCRWSCESVATRERNRGCLRRFTAQSGRICYVDIRVRRRLIAARDDKAIAEIIVENDLAEVLGRHNKALGAKDQNKLGVVIGIEERPMIGYIAAAILGARRRAEMIRRVQRRDTGKKECTTSGHSLEVFI